MRSCFISPNQLVSCGCKNVVAIIIRKSRVLGNAYFNRIAIFVEAYLKKSRVVKSEIGNDLEVQKIIDFIYENIFTAYLQWIISVDLLWNIIVNFRVLLHIGFHKFIKRML